MFALTLRRLAAAFGLLILAGACFGTAAPGAASAPGAPARLIYAGWYGNTIPTPAYIRDNRAFLETQPFDGLAVYLRNPSMTVNVSTGVMTPNPMPYDTIASVLAPIAGLPFTTLKHNFATVFGSTPPDFFDSWATTVQNFANLARAARDAGLAGVLFDNEQYFTPWGNYPDGVRYPARTLQEYRDQARLRGKEVMEAMVAQFPTIAVITLHGPYVSEPQAPTSLGFPQWWSSNELLGPFFAGFMEGVGTGGAANVDGGELYALRTASQFRGSYDWRKYDLPSDAVNCPFIPAALRPLWPGRSNLSFGIYDRPFGGAGMDPAILRSTIANALRQADSYVWFYAEAYTYLRPADQGGAPQVWVDAVRQGRADAGTGSAPAPPENLAAVAGSSTRIDLSWSDRSSNETGFEVERKTGAGGTWGPVAPVGANVTTYGDVSLAAQTTYVYRVRATNASGASPYSNEASATTGAPPAGGTAPPPGGEGRRGGSCGLLGLEALAVLALLRRRTPMKQTVCFMEGGRAGGGGRI